MLYHYAQSTYNNGLKQPLYSSKQVDISSAALTSKFSINNHNKQQNIIQISKCWHFLLITQRFSRLSQANATQISSFSYFIHKIASNQKKSQQNKYQRTAQLGKTCIPHGPTDVSSSVLAILINPFSPQPVPKLFCTTQQVTLQGLAFQSQLTSQSYPMTTTEWLISSGSQSAASQIPPAQLVKQQELALIQTTTGAVLTASLRAGSLQVATATQSLILKGFLLAFVELQVVPMPVQEQLELEANPTFFIYNQEVKTLPPPHPELPQGLAVVQSTNCWPERLIADQFLGALTWVLYWMLMAQEEAKAQPEPQFPLGFWQS